MARPVQLRYNDATDGETVIGTYLTGDNLINDFQMKNSGSGEYTRVELLADLQFRDNIPIDYSQYGLAQNGESEPEILVYSYDTSTDSFTLRDRVFPEKKGTIDDKGTYRNDDLWGFQKWVGRQRVTGVSETNATITDIVNALLPSGYTAVTPPGDTVPTLDSYSYNGKIDKAIRDIIRDYPVKIWFTPELDSGDYVVKVQSKGFGGVTETVTFDSERQDAGYEILEFDEQDKTNIINKVTVEGVDPNGVKISETVEDSASISSHGERSIYRHVGYLQDATQATNIANDILNPDPSPHAVLSIPFQNDNILNESIDILDDRYGIDAVYTVVKQRDFYTDSKTEVEVGFEKNRSEERRDADRDLDEQNHRLFPGDTINGGNSNTTTAETDLTVKDEGQNFDTTPNIPTGFSTAEGGSSRNSFGTQVSDASEILTNGNWEFVGATFLTESTPEEENQHWHVSIRYEPDSTPASSLVRQNTDLRIRIWEEDSSNNVEYYPDSDGVKCFNQNVSPDGSTTWNAAADDILIEIPRYLPDASYQLQVQASPVDLDALIWAKVSAKTKHSHAGGTYESLDHNHAAGVDNDPGHGDTTDTFTHNIELKDSDNNDLGNVNVASEDKTDR